MLRKKNKQNLIYATSCFHLLIATLSFNFSALSSAATIAESERHCVSSSQNLKNQASYSYDNQTNPQPIILENILSNEVVTQVAPLGTVVITGRGIKDNNNKFITGSATGVLNDRLVQIGFTQEEANQSILGVVKAWKELPSDTNFQDFAIASKKAIIEAVPAKSSILSALGNSDLEQATNLSIKIFGSLLEMAGLTLEESKSATETALETIKNMPTNSNLDRVAQTALDAMISQQPDKVAAIELAGQAFSQDLKNARSGNQTGIRKGDVLKFKYLLSNPGSTPIKVLIPNFGNNSTTKNEITLSSREQLDVTLEVTAGEISNGGTRVTGFLKYQEDGSLEPQVTGSGAISGLTYQAIAANSNPEATIDCSTPTQTVAMLPLMTNELIDPLGQVTGCGGNLLPDYTGFNVGLYKPDPNDPTGGITQAIELTGTELPDVPGNNIPKGIEPNTENSNPYFLTNGKQGRYSFLLDPNRGQLDRGSTYILLVNPPANSIYSQRRIRLVIGDRTGNTIAYRATSLDGKSISATDGRTSVDGTIEIDDAERVGLVLAVMGVNFNVCQAQSIQITKTADRAAAEPGDTVIYRLSIKNLASSTLEKIVIADTLPLGFRFLPDSVRAEIQRNPVAVTTTQNASTVQFNVPGTLGSGRILNIAYAATLTPDALRGTGRNSALVNGQRVDTQQGVKDGPAIHQLRVKSGIISDYGTIVGRVFVDKDFDGEQQPGEPGVPNAVIFLDDGTRITTDADGLFSISNMLPGYRTGVLDLSAIPGYTLAPNRRFSERNSQSRLVHLAPGGLVRMNFAITPAATVEEAQ